MSILSGHISTIIINFEEINKDESRSHKLLILYIDPDAKCLSLLLLYYSSHLISSIFEPIHLLKMLKLSVVVKTVMIQSSLFVVLFGLRFDRVRNGDDSVDIVPSDFEIISFHFFASSNCPTLVVLEATLVFFLLVVICEMNAC